MILTNCSYYLFWLPFEKIMTILKSQIIYDSFNLYSICTYQNLMSYPQEVGIIYRKDVVFVNVVASIEQPQHNNWAIAKKKKVINKHEYIMCGWCIALCCYGFPTILVTEIFIIISMSKHQSNLTSFSVVSWIVVVAFNSSHNLK